VRAGKIGQSLSRCVRDILEGNVEIEDVFVVISRTRIPTREGLRSVMEEYTYRNDVTSLYGHDIEKIMEVVYKLWDDGKLHQPRLSPNGHSFSGLAQDVWLDITPLPSFHNPTVVEAYQHYDMLRKLTE
jgi:hypothetical protein